MVRMLQKSTITREELHAELQAFGDGLQKQLCLALEKTIDEKLGRPRSGPRLSLRSAGSHNVPIEENKSSLPPSSQIQPCASTVHQWSDSESEDEADSATNKVDGAWNARRMRTYVSDYGNKRSGVPSAKQTISDDEHTTRVDSKTSALAQQTEQTRWGVISAFVRGTSFDYVSGAFVVLNAISLGVQTDWQARNVTDETNAGFKAVETLFAIVFTIELLLRLLVYKWDFFKFPHVGWHLFDCLLVGTQLLDEIVFIVVSTQGTSAEGNSGTDDGEQSDMSSNMSALRMMRILRLIRVMRLVRVLRLIGELRTMVLSIIGCLRALVWAMMLLFLVMYIVGIYLTQMVLDTRLAARRDDTPVTEDLSLFYGSLGSTVVSLYQAITGGEDWKSFLDPLRLDVSAAMTPLFILYIGFSLLCMLNVITGVFVESALKEAKKDKDTYMMSHVRGLFDRVDVDGSGSITLAEFSDMCDKPEMKEVFKEIETDVAEAKGIFHLLDADNSGTIDPDEFFHGFHRLRGPAKALDLQFLMRGTDRIADLCVENAKKSEKMFKRITKRLEQVANMPGSPKQSQANHRQAQSNNAQQKAPARTLDEFRQEHNTPYQRNAVRRGALQDCADPMSAVPGVIEEELST
eukprot:TRINITY_DN16969_c0_g1_i1.p1 TRINITY_DN16969_c0_g1~~TRINITY_DN16969_c0_g1_i1.p1  ORF type:complete len:633 (-),score=69.19 TRINITY_DN16969_c0_g1_i1:211-2109(-)